MSFPSPSLTPPALSPFQLSYGGLTFGGLSTAGAYQLQSLQVDMPDVISGDVQRALDQGEFAGLDILPGADITVVQTVRASSTPRGPAYAQQILADSPSSYWRLDEASTTEFVHDFAGPYRGSYVGGVTLGQTGALAEDPDAAALFNGSTGYVDVGTCPPALKLTGPLSCEAWFSTASAAAQQGLIGNYSSGSFGFILRLSSGNPSFWVGGSQAIAGATYNDGNWHHVVGTWDGATIRLYVDGALVASTAFAGPLAYSTVQHLQLASYNSASSGVIANPFAGTLDEPAIYGYALSAGQVAAHYAIGTAGPASASSTSVDQAAQQLGGVLGPGGTIESPLWLCLPSGTFCRLCRPRKHNCPIDIKRVFAKAAVATTLFHSTDPRWYQAPSNSQTVGLPAALGGGAAVPWVLGPSGLPFGSGGVGGLLTVVNAGPFESRPVLVVTGPCTNPQISNLSIPGAPSIGVNITLNAGDTLEIDTDWQSVIYTVAGSTLGSSRRNLLMGAITWWNLPANSSSTIEFTSQDTSPVAGTLTVQSASAWLSL